MSFSSFDLSGKTALVTGGSIGIGRALVLALAEAGADVLIADMDKATGDATAEAVRCAGRAAHFVRCDVRVEEEIVAAVHSATQHFGRLDIAVNNAGIYRAGDDADQPQSDWDAVLAVNLTGVWLSARAEMQAMRKTGGGKIINIASIGGTIACSNGSYDAAKAGVIHLTRTLAARWGRYNINMNCISPGYVIAAMGTTRSLEERAHLRSLTPMGYVQRPEDLGGPLVFLASAAADFVTGQNLIVDGGHTLAPWLAPLERDLPPRISPAEEILGVKADLAARGVVFDNDGLIADQS